MEATIFRKFKGHDVYIQTEGKEYYVSFGSPDLQNYWVGAFERILEKRPDHEFDVETPDGPMKINIQELRSLIEDINILIKVL